MLEGSQLSPETIDKLGFKAANPTLASATCGFSLKWSRTSLQTRQLVNSAEVTKHINVTSEMSQIDFLLAHKQEGRKTTQNTWWPGCCHNYWGPQGPPHLSIVQCMWLYKAVEWPQALSIPAFQGLNIWQNYPLQGWVFKITKADHLKSDLSLLCPKLETLNEQASSLQLSSGSCTFSRLLQVSSKILFSGRISREGQVSSMIWHTFDNYHPWDLNCVKFEYIFGNDSRIPIINPVKLYYKFHITACQSNTKYVTPAPMTPSQLWPVPGHFV